MDSPKSGLTFEPPETEDTERSRFLLEWSQVGGAIFDEVLKIGRPGQILVKVHHDRERPKKIDADVQNNLLKRELD